MIYIILAYLALLIVIGELMLIIFNLKTKCKQLKTLNFYYEKVNHLLKNKLAQYKPINHTRGTEA